MKPFKVLYITFSSKSVLHMLNPLLKVWFNYMDILNRIIDKFLSVKDFS